MNKTVIKKTYILFTIFLFSLILASCNTSKNNEEKEEYYEVGFEDKNYGWYYSYTELLYSTGIRVKSTTSLEQEIEVYYGFNKKYYRKIIYATDEEPEPEVYDFVYVTNDTDLTQIIKFTLYRYTWENSPSIYEHNTIKKEIFSFTNSLGWFFDNNILNFEYKLAEFMFVDKVSADDLVYYENESVLLYAYDLTPIDSDYIDAVFYQGMTPKRLIELEERAGMEYPKENYILYNHPTSIFSTNNSKIVVKKNKKNELTFVKPTIYVPKPGEMW